MAPPGALPSGSIFNDFSEQMSNFNREAGLWGLSGRHSRTKCGKCVYRSGQVGGWPGTWRLLGISVRRERTLCLYSVSRMGQVWGYTGICRGESQLICFCVRCTWVCACIVPTWRSEGNVQELVLSFGSRDWTQVIRLDIKPPLPLSHLLSPYSVSLNHITVSLDIPYACFRSIPLSLHRVAELGRWSLDKRWGGHTQNTWHKAFCHLYKRLWAHGDFYFIFQCVWGWGAVHVSSGALRSQGMESSGAGCVLPVVGAGY